jgi:hypothetical protein
MPPAGSVDQPSRGGVASRPVSRVLYGLRRNRRRDDHSSGTAVAGRLEQPTRTRSGDGPAAALAGSRVRPYSVLLPVGLAVPRMLPSARCALTAPFHPYRPANRRRFAFCGAFPGVTPAGHYPAPYLRGARTFLRNAAVIRPTGPSGNRQSCGARQSAVRRAAMMRCMK